MKLRGIIVSLLSVSCATGAAATCKRLTDADSTFVSALALTMNIKDSDIDTTMFKGIDAAYPWLSKCIASVNPYTVVTSTLLSSGFSSCNKTISAYTMPADLTDASMRTSLCPFYGNTLMPCINNVLVQAVVDAMAAAGACCDDMKAQILANFGSDLKTMAADLLNNVGAVGCSIKTFTNSAGKSTTESCGHALMNSFLTDSSMINMLPMMQMPTDQVCKAMTGQLFTTTAGTSAQFTWATLGLQTFGICYEPLSSLFKTLASYPMMSTMSSTINGVTVAMADLFTSGKCLKTSSIVAWLTDSNSLPMMIARSLDDAKQEASSSSQSGNYSYVGSMNLTTQLKNVLTQYQTVLPVSCMHFASGQKCDYSGATVGVSYSVDGNLQSSKKSLASSTVELSLAAAALTMAMSLVVT